MDPLSGQRVEERRGHECCSEGRGDATQRTYGSRKIDSLANSASTPSTKHPNTPVALIRHFEILSANHLTKYTSTPPIAWSERTEASAARRCRSASGRDPSSVGWPGRMGRAVDGGMRAEVRRVK